MSSKDQCYFKERENLDGKKDIVLIIDCFNCSEKKNNFFNSKKCLFCFLRVLFTNKNRRFDYISILWNEIVISKDQFELILDYFKIIKGIKKNYDKIEIKRNEKCKFKEFKCKIFSNNHSSFKIKDQEYFDPFFVYNHTLKSLSNIKKNIVNDSKCENCYNSIENLLMSILRILESLKIIKVIKTFSKSSEISLKNISFYEFLFSGKLVLLQNFQEKPNLISYDKKPIISYLVGDYDCYQVEIFDNKFENEKSYQIVPFYKGREKEDFFEKIIQDVLNNIEILELDQIIPLEKLIEFYLKEALKIINIKYEFSSNVKNKICFLTAVKKLNLDKLFPLLVDDYIEEIFLDSPQDEIYVNHQIFHRCRTKIILNSKDIERIKVLIRLYSGQRLDFKNPTIKFVMKNKFFYCRFSIDVEPIQINNFALDIRKLNKNILTIQDLIKNSTLDPLMAAFLYFCVLRRMNITVTGETDTGKTTFINALDLIGPKEHRKIYVENVTESLNQEGFGKHQLKYRVDSLEEFAIERYSKSNQIKTLLHRTPDIIYLGEILTKEEAQAMFQCLAAGLRGFQTIHSKNIDALINRFIFHFNINKSCLNDLDILILMKKKQNDRKIIGIYEICKFDDSENGLYSSIFEYNPQTDNWVLKKPLYETNMYQEIQKYEDLPEESFMRLIRMYKEIFDFLSNLEKIDNLRLIDFFHKISYYSEGSFEKLKQFWINWKKNRSLNF
ncbi:MAG: ATPase, T2SS/T4P/T4SS family [Promethearchaeota archaeon]